MTDARDAPEPLGRPGRAPPPFPTPPAAWSRWRSASTSGPPSSRRPCPRPAIAPDAARRPARRWSAPSTCSPTTTTRRLRTRGKSTPDLLRPAPATSPTHPTRWSGPAATTTSPPCSAYAVEHHLAVVPFGGGTSVTGGLAARREGYAGLLSLDLIRMKRLLAVDPTSMTATLEPGLRGPEAEALLAEHGLTLGHFPQSFEFATDRRLRRHPLQRPVQRRLRPLRRAGRRPDRRHPERPARPRLGAGQRRRPRPAPADPRLRGRLRRDHLGHRAGAHAARDQGVRRAGAGRPSPTAPPRCGPWPSPGCCRP